MHIYNPKEWFKAVFFVHQSDTLRKLTPFILMTFVYSAIVAYIEMEYFKLAEISWVKNITVVHNLLGFVLSLLLVFRTNTAYDRWWEARKQWGALTNTSRNLAIKLQAMLPNDDKANRHYFRKMIPLFAQSLFSFLRANSTAFMLDDEEHPELKDAFSTKKHGPNQVASHLISKINALFKEKKISGEQFIILQNEMESFTNITGACERIKNTPIPQSYSSFIKKFIVIYVATLPMGYVFSMGYFVVLAVPFIFYVLASLELIAESIEEPFGIDSDDIPIEKIAENIRKHTHEIILP